MGIESDVQNADSRLAVRFFSRPVQNIFESTVQGRPIFMDVDMITIYVPGDSTLTVDAEVREDHKARFPIQWAHYQNKHGDDAKHVGTPLSEWPLITAAAAEELRGIKFHTVDSIANGSDNQLQNIGMKGGMNPLELRKRAINFLKTAAEEASTNALNEEITRLKAENASIKVENASIKVETDAKMAETDAKMAEMQNQMQQILAAVKPEVATKKRGNPNFGKKPVEATV